MMKLLACTVLCALAPTAFAANSLIRVDCMEGTAGAKVSINGKYQFTCVDFQKEPISLQAGDYTITAVQPVSKEYERVFTESISLKPGVPKRIRVELPEKTLTEFGQAEAARQQEQARLAAQAEQQRQRQEAVKKDIEDAQAGDPDAMQRLAERYRTGDGVDQDSDKARQWSKKAIEATRKQAREQQIADLKQSLDNTSYFGGTKSFARDMAAAADHGTPAQKTILPSATFLNIPICILVDVTSMPTVTAKRKGIQKQLDELETHAARWVKPDSMVAQAYAARHAAD